VHCVADCIRDSVFHAIRPDGDSGTNQSLRSEKNMGSDMVAVDSARPAVEAISNGPAFELKRIAESVVERRYRGCTLGSRTEDPGSSISILRKYLVLPYYALGLYVSLVFLCKNCGRQSDGEGVSYGSLKSPGCSCVSITLPAAS